MKLKIFALESLRGLAALVVFLGHFVQVFGGRQWFDKMGVGFFLNGTASVYLFFVLSGFVLSYKFWLRYSYDNLVFSSFYRFFRLFFMVVLCGFLGWVLYRIGFLHVDKEISFFVFVRESFLVFLNGKHFDVVFWTMKYELFGSLVLFLGIYFAYSPPPFKHTPIRTPYRAREIFWAIAISFILIVCVLDFYHILPWRVGVKYFALFFIGALASSVYVKNPHREFRSLWWLLPWILCCYILFDRRLILLQYDESGVVDFLGYCIVCFVVLYGVLTIRIIRRLLEHRFFVFLGKISFAFYASHMIVFWSIGLWVFGYFHNLSFFPRFCIVFAVCSVVNILIARYLTALDELWVQKIKTLKPYFSKTNQK